MSGSTADPMLSPTWSSCAACAAPDSRARARPGARKPRAPAPVALGALTPRATEVLRLIARGLSNAEISESLTIAEQTTKSHVGRILAKLDLRDGAQAVVVAYESGLVTPGARAAGPRCHWPPAAS